MNLTDSFHTRVVLLHSNDIHSRLEHAARIATLIAEERRSYGSDHVLAVDCGDHMDRMRVETEGSDGAVNVELLNHAGYEVITLGNNEGLTYSSQIISDAYRDRAKFSIVCANMLDSQTGELPEWLLPSTIVHKNGLRIGLIGATASYTEFYSLLGWQVTDPFKAVQEQVSKLREHVDVVVVMSHLGINVDKLLAEKIDGIDLILGAHTHHLLEEPLFIEGTTICAAGKFGEYLGRVEIGIDPISTRPVFRAAVVPTAALAEHPEAAAIIGSYLKAGQQRLSRVIARLESPLPARAERESPLGNLLAAGLRRWTDAEIGMVNTGQLLGGLAQGDVTAGELHALCPSPINPCLMTIAGMEIRIALEQALLPEFIHKPIKGYGFRGEVLGTLAVDGLTIAYDPAKPQMSRLTSVSVNGEPLEDERLYRLGTIDMFSFKAGYESLANAVQQQYYLPEFIRDVIATQLQDPSAIIESRRLRWENRSL
ncbi:2',3'-cyclic-nucleotide 2'-phosphodiesterase (5'-nucleotidase family) [Paenibacillus endophyticus]|uniref:2',3'-cyclic-nucleotide 2'-phosphodiesterase (5'-nucleotidase family) n=1 Tax=Paenibacillus endophyticus TaxID=1294268 RepID=A0A7W5GC48_9BACL|nr:bifunctional UDP-sugar hydrolase/5'-nucleotidase [Paenibacillus endophyticus]MBB3154989.1 2',3'-cyclic-nucleotide 2'-phosphodiesterase (5'-nucleotidase family) [Paenibacillus endophyticus]